MVEIKKGRSFTNEDDADSIDVGDENDTEQRWVKRNGKLWREQWYNRIKELPRGSEEAYKTFAKGNFDLLNQSIDSHRANISRMSDKWEVDLEKGQLRG